MANREIWEWDTNPNDNDFVAADGGWPEGMKRSDVNEAARGNLAATRNFYNDREWIRVDIQGPDAADIGTVTRPSPTSRPAAVPYRQWPDADLRHHGHHQSGPWRHVHDRRLLTDLII